MRKLLIATVAVSALLGATAANADYYHNRHRGGGGYHHHRGNGWVAPLIGGMVLGGALYGLSQQPSYAAPPQVYVEPPSYYREPICRDVFIGYDSWNRPRYRIDCY